MIERRSTERVGAYAAFSQDEGLLFPLTREETRQYVRSALQEDDAFNDITSIATVLSERRGQCRMVSRNDGVIAGIPLAAEAFRQLDPSADIRIDIQDGARVSEGSLVMFIAGHLRCILSAERVALNFMQCLSGIATLTSKYVDAVQGTGVRILDTRKTTPGWRRLEKYAVRAGGGMNHRMDLASAVLIKDNHIAAVDGDIATAIQRARAIAPLGVKVEVECDRQDQVEQALSAGADIILLDNMTTDDMRDCVEFVHGRAILEASGGIKLENVRDVADTGVDWISVGALTHSAPALDLSLDFD